MRELTPIKLPCPVCNGDGFASCGDRHTETRMDVCGRCGGDGVIDPETGQTPEASARPHEACTPQEALSSDVVAIKAENDLLRSLLLPIRDYAAVRLRDDLGGDGEIGACYRDGVRSSLRLDSLRAILRALPPDGESAAIDPGF